MSDLPGMPVAPDSSPAAREPRARAIEFRSSNATSRNLKKICSKESLTNPARVRLLAGLHAMAFPAQSLQVGDLIRATKIHRNHMISLKPLAGRRMQTAPLTSKPIPAKRRLPSPLTTMLRPALLRGRPRIRQPVSRTSRLETQIAAHHARSREPASIRHGSTPAFRVRLAHGDRGSRRLAGARMCHQARISTTHPARVFAVLAAVTARAKNAQFRHSIHSKAPFQKT